MLSNNNAIRIGLASSAKLSADVFSDGGSKSMHNCIITDSLVELDYLVVLFGLDHPIDVECRVGNTLFIYGEPPTKQICSPEFLKQFSHVIGCNVNEGHPGSIVDHLPLGWMVGHNFRDSSKSLGYGDLVNVQRPDKSKDLSVIISNKRKTSGQRLRLRFLEQAIKHFGDRLDVYGRGFKEIDDKWDAIAPYRFHIVLENSFLDHYWTEKIADAFLGYSFPFYYGCPNLESYFDAESFRRIDITDAPRAINVIEQGIANDIDSISRDALGRSRSKILTDYHMVRYLSEYAVRLFRNTPREWFTIMPNHSYVSRIESWGRKLRFFAGRCSDYFRYR